MIVVAEPDEVDDLVRELQRAPERNGTVVGSFAATAAASTSLPPRRPLLTMARDEHASVVVLGRAAQSDDDVVEQASILHEEGVRIRTMSLFYEQWLGKLPITELERVSLLFDIGEVHAARYARVKRLLDVALALCGCARARGDHADRPRGRSHREPRAAAVPASPAPVATASNSRCSSSARCARPRRRPSCRRRNGQRKVTRRVTRFGRVLRRTHLDELPQVVNVLRGELSAVGPRPEQPQIVAKLDGKIPFYRTRHLVRPGVTGWAQVKYPYAATEAETLQKLQYEIYYLRRQSLGLDLRIVGRTVRLVVGRHGR